MEIKGRVIFNLGVQAGTSKAGKEWKKASIVIETEGQYPKKIAMDNLKNADAFGALAVGTVGTFHIEIESREFNGRWYTSVNCYKWEAASPYPQQPYAPQQPYQQPYGSTGYPPQQPYGQTQGMQPYQPQAPQSPYPTAQPLPPGTAEDTEDLPF